MTKLILADLDHGFETRTDQIGQSRLNEQMTKLAAQGTKLGFLTANSYAKVIQQFKGMQAPAVVVCERGAETIVDRVVKDEATIDYHIWQSALQWVQSNRDFNTAYIVLSGKLNAYTDATPDSKAYPQIKAEYPSRYQIKNIELVSDLVYQIRLIFDDDQEIENKAQTFNNHFNGKLVAHALGNQIAITAVEASYANSIDGLKTELSLNDADVTVINDHSDAIDQLFDDPATKSGYDAIDQLIK
ncbi:HAD hydrolase family protein [Nicoliella lavandulae]|uniref:HAD hydrolase family protein n=1 Tax=Nicoliella lavandulae TaxID=3082954 RepID=A0ABU8SJH7_9LACO